MGAFASLSLALVGLVGFVALAWRSRRWRRAGDHPHCRRCDFDLFGLPAESTRCPECGADLAAPDATAIGARQPARFVRWAAVVGAIACAAASFHFGRGVDWIGHRVRWSPTSWLIADVRPPANISPFQVAALAELERRLYATSDPRQALAIVGALKTLDLGVRPSVRAGDRLPIELYVGGPKTMLAMAAAAPAGVAAPYDVEARCVRATLADGTPVPPYAYGPSHFSVRTTGMRTDQKLAIPRDAAVGPTRVRAVYEFRLKRRGHVGGATDLRADPAREGELEAGVVVAWDRAYDLPVTILPADAGDGVELVRDDSLRAAMQGAVSPPSRLRIERRGTDAFARCDWGFSSPPVGVACDVLLRAGGQELAMGRIYADAGSSSMTFSASSHADRPRAAAWTSERADVVLRPSVERARSTLKLTRIWGEEIVFRDVPVKLDR